MENCASTLSHVQVIPRSEIPAIYTSHDHGQVRDIGELKILYNHPLLKQFLPSASKLSFAWAYLAHGKTLASHSHDDTSAVIIVYQGSADLTGQISAKITAGDILVVPPNCEYALHNTSSDGFHAVSIIFSAENSSSSVKDISHELSFRGLFAHNAQRQNKILKNNFFRIMQDNTLDDPKKRQVFLNAVQVFSDLFQIMLFSRQATCFDEKYKTTFLSHFREEFGHNELLATRNNKSKINDFILKATSAWFCHQMFLADNLEKTILMHLIVEGCGYYYHVHAQKKIQQDVKSDYYQIHTEHDEEHAAMATELLKNQHPNTYRKLHQVLDDGWDMLNAMQERVAFLVESSG